jgi:addiction module HigA family antidote
MSTKVATRQSKASTRRLDSVTPGELLEEEFMIPLGITAYRLAKEINIPAQRIGEIVKGRRGITADTDLRLCRFFELSDGYWLRAQAAYDIQVAQSKLGKTLKIIKPWSSQVAL